MKLKKILAILLAAALCLCSFAACGSTESGSVSESITSALADVAQRNTGMPLPNPVDGVHSDTNFSDMHWYIYDTTEYNAAVDKLAASTDGAEAIELYEWLRGEYYLVSTLDDLAYIDFYANLESEDISDACQELDSMCTDMLDALYTALSTALDSAAGEELEAYFGEEIAQELRDYEEMTDRESEISDRLSELQLQYNTLITQSLTYAEMTEQIGGLYLELVSLYNEYAQLYGYDTYAEYAYENVYVRDFTPEDAAALCEAVKPYAREYFSALYTDAATYTDFTVDTDLTSDELLELLTVYMPSISPDAVEAAEYMVSHGLYYLDSAGSIADMGFTTTLRYYNAPFIYNALYGTDYDISSMFHEFGHYYDAYVNTPEDYLLNVGSYDIFEIHSNGMEALSTGWYDDIYGEEADLAHIKYLDNVLYSIITGCLFDEFQRTVYSDPDMTAEEINDTFVSVAESYGLSSYSRSFDTYWMQVNHNFEQPFYYISYAVSALASLQLYEKAQEDWDAAAELYNTLIGLGAYDYTYCELLEMAGLESFTDGLPACVPQAVEDMSALCLVFDMKNAA